MNHQVSTTQPHLHHFNEVLIRQTSKYNSPHLATQPYVEAGGRNQFSSYYRYRNKDQDFV